MKNLSTTILLLIAALLTASANVIVSGRSYRLAAPGDKGYLTTSAGVLSLAPSAEEGSTFYFEPAAGGILLHCGGDNTYVLKGTAGEAVKTGSRYASDESLAQPDAFTILTKGSNVMLRDKASGLQLNMYINDEGAALHSGEGDASQWKILRADNNSAVTVPEEGTDYYLQTQMTAKIGQYAWNDGGTIKLKAERDESCLFRFVSNGNGSWYVRHVQSGTEISGGAQGQLVSLSKTHAGAEDRAQLFQTVETENGVTLKAAGEDLYLSLTAENRIILSAEATAWTAEGIMFPHPGVCYRIVSKQNAQRFMSEESDGSVVVAGYDTSVRCFWQFVPTEKDGCYYIRNLTTGRYIESCNKTPSSQSRISTSTRPVEFYVGKNETNGTATYGYYYFSSTDCEGYTDPGRSPRALNKDGASDHVITWTAGQGDQNSYWDILPTEYLYEPRPVLSSNSLEKADFEYTMTSLATGRNLEVTANGGLVWTEKSDRPEQSWYFTGTGGSTGGYAIATAAQPGLTLNLTDGQLSVGRTDEPTRWSILEKIEGEKTTFYFRPFESRFTEGTALSVDGDSLLVFGARRSRFARAAGIYQMPCGQLGQNYISRLNVKSSVKTLDYPLNILSGKNIIVQSARPSSWYTLYTADKGTVVRGSDFVLTTALQNAPDAGDALLAYFDWDGDGVFEQTVALGSMQNSETRLDVPAEARIGKCRMRLRLTANGLTDAEDEVAGQTVDFILNVTDKNSSTPTVKVRPNDPARGKAELTEGTDEEVTVTATPLGNATFVCWREGNNVRSVAASYSFTPDHDTELTACFSPNTDPNTGIGQLIDTDERNVAVTVTADNRTIHLATEADIKLALVFTTGGTCVGRADGKNPEIEVPEAGTYIVKIYTATRDASKKITVK